MSIHLEIVSGPRAGKIIPLSGKQFIVGRERDCHLRLKSELVSRHHCVFRQDEFTVRVRDLGSRNGTIINGSKIRGEVILGDGDSLLIGDTSLQIRTNQSEATEETVANAQTPTTEIYDGKTAAAPAAVNEQPQQALPTLDELESAPIVPSSSPTGPDADSGETLPRELN